MSSSVRFDGTRNRRHLSNPFARLRLAPKSEFEHIIEEGYSTDVFGWFGEAWLLFSTNLGAILLTSMPAAVSALIIFFLYYRSFGRESVAADMLFGSYFRTILLMALAYLPSFATLSVMVRGKCPIKDAFSSLLKFPGLLIVSAFVWSPLIFSGLMRDMRGIIWWAIPFSLYFAVSYSFSPYLIVDGKLGFWSALETSRRAISRNWFGIAAMYAFFYPAGWVFSAALSMIPGIIGTVFVVDEMSSRRWDDPMNIMFGLSNVFMAGLFFLFLIFFQIALATAYLRIFRPIGYRRESGK